MRDGGAPAESRAGRAGFAARNGTPVERRETANGAGLSSFLAGRVARGAVVPVECGQRAMVGLDPLRAFLEGGASRCRRGHTRLAAGTEEKKARLQV